MSELPKLTVKEFDPNDRPREKALNFGIHTLSKAELLALILRTGTVSRPITDICKELLQSCGDSLCHLTRKNTKELMMVNGIGAVKAQQIEAIMELNKRFHEEKAHDAMIAIKSSTDIWNNMRYEIGNLNHEEVWLLTLSQRNSIIGRHKLTSGNYNSSLFDVKPAMKHAILDEAISIALVHNHPSGNLNPSGSDDNITRSIKTAANSLNIRVLDHVIVTTDDFYSYSDNGRL